jgi:threonine dehydratase
MISDTRLITLKEISAARERLRGVALHTPLVRMEDSGGPGRLWIKAESRQPIGSFKLRGAYNKIASLSDEERQRGVITYSSGNHAQGVAFAARALGLKAVIVMPSNTPEIKLRGTRSLGAEVVLVGPGSEERLERAERLAAQFGYVIVPPYNDPAIIAGQGTCGLEILEDLPDVDLVLAPVGGGGLLSGVSTAVKLSRPGAKVFGVEPELASDAAESFRAGKIVSASAEDTNRTLADGLRAQSIGALNFAHIQAYVDGIVTVSEEEIRGAMRRMIASTGLVPEPSGAVAVAAALYHRAELPPFVDAVAVMSGGNVEPDVLRRVMDEVNG